jgi:hypothetical protein
MRGTYERLQEFCKRRANQQRAEFLPSTRAQAAERNGLLGRQVDDNEAINSSLLAVLEEALLAVAEKRVVVSHEQNGRLEAARAGLADHLQRRLDGDAILQGDGV